MKPENLEAIRASFGVQARAFESGKMNFSKKEYLDYTLACIAAQAGEDVLEVAAGTCACGRALAPYARSVTCLDATPAMLEVGREACAREGIGNLRPVIGYAEELPFLDASFDIVVSRLAFHHFTQIERPFQEMARVLKPGGRLVLIDMEAAAQPLRAVEDRIETLRDPSHIKNRSAEELRALYAQNGLRVERCQSTPIPVALENWMELTQTPQPVRAQITALMQCELAGGEKTGFAPYLREGQLYFDQRWVLIIGSR